MRLISTKERGKKNVGQGKKLTHPREVLDHDQRNAGELSGCQGGTSVPVVLALDPCSPHQTYAQRPTVLRPVSIYFLLPTLSIDTGVLKIMSKMGISLLSSYHGAQIFEAIGVGEDLLTLGFRGTPSRLGGLTTEDLASETASFMVRAYILYGILRNEFQEPVSKTSSVSMPQDGFQEAVVSDRLYLHASE